MYRNQFWLPFPDRNVLLLGITAEVYANCDTGLVGAKLSELAGASKCAKLFSALRSVRHDLGVARIALRVKRLGALSAVLLSPPPRGATEVVEGLR